MWPKRYKDYPVDSQLKKKHVEPGKGVIGCEMHEINGWGNSYHITEKDWKTMDFNKEIEEN